jgi:pyruvate-formate lyase
MTAVRNEYKSNFYPSQRLQKLIQKNQEVAASGRRNLYTADSTQLVYHWTDKANGIVPQTCEWSFPKETSYSLGDHACRVDIGIDFPFYDQVPSRIEGYEATPLSWAKDYAFLLRHSPAEIYDNEIIVGEFHWEMNEVRKYYFGDNVHEIGREVRKLGAGGTSHGHTCLDFSIGLSQGWGGIMQRIDESLSLYTRLEEPNKAQYLSGLKLVCQAIMDFIDKHSKTAYELAQNTSNHDEKERYLFIAENCKAITYNAPKTYCQAVQWIHFAILSDRIVGHGNGYGRLDLYLNSFLMQDLKAGILSLQDAREYLAEMFLKVRGQHFSICGRLKDGSDATNKMSRVILETYDMVDDYNNLFLLWHPDIDQDLFLYACDVLARHGAGVPTFCNYDLFVDCELRSGVSMDDAWSVAIGGCQWFSIPGKEYCDQDVNSIVLLDPMWRAMDRCIDEGTKDFERFYQVFVDELKKTCEALRVFKDAQYDVIDKIWPEMATSLHFHGPIERGIDITGHRGVDYQYTSVNILGIPNVADSMYAIQQLVFEKQMYSLAEVRQATSNNWKSNDIMRTRFLRQSKFGNDIDEVDTLLVRITNSIADILDNQYNNRGQQYRASLFQFQGHTAVDVLPATPDGRYSHEPLAHGCNPTAGRNTKGLQATANSLSKIHNHKFLGGTLQVELQPKMFDGKENLAEYIKIFSEAYFSKNNFQINLNIIDLNQLKDAIEHPNKPEYQNIIIKVTGYTTRFVCLAKPFQIEFCGRTNYDTI